VQGKGWPLDGYVNARPWREYFTKKWLSEWAVFDNRWDSEVAVSKVVNDNKVIAGAMRRQSDQATNAQRNINIIKRMDFLNNRKDVFGVNLEVALKYFRDYRNDPSTPYYAIKKLPSDL